MLLKLQILTLLRSWKQWMLILVSALDDWHFSLSNECVVTFYLDILIIFNWVKGLLFSKLLLRIWLVRWMNIALMLPNVWFYMGQLLLASVQHLGFWKSVLQQILCISVFVVPNKANWIVKLLNPRMIKQKLSLCFIWHCSCINKHVNTNFLYTFSSLWSMYWMFDEVALFLI